MRASLEKYFLLRHEREQVEAREEAEQVLQEIPFDVIDEHLRRRREEAKDYLRWSGKE